MSDSKEKGKIQIHYLKNPEYRSIFADGAIGGITPVNKVNLAFFATRKVIPKTVEYELDKESALGEGKVAESIGGIVREIEFSVYMDRSAASDLYDFLHKVLEKDGKRD